MRRVNTLLRRTALPLGFVVALVALLLMVSPASAQEPPEAESGARLHPGINLIGWVGEPTPVSQLFREIPQLEAIWTWDAELDEWIVAARNAPEWLGGLGRVTAGMGLRMQLGGDAPVIWERSTKPTRGLVKLRTGWNLVAWSGADSAAIENVAKGIGWSLRSIRRWDAATQQWATWTSPERSAQVIADTGDEEEAESSGVRRGEALWVQVSRSVNWLQPTDILPRLVFPGGASQSLQTRVREDLEAVLSYYRDQYGIQAEPDFTIYVAENVDALIQAYKDDGKEVDDAYEASTRALWERIPGWASGDEFVLAQGFWSDDGATDRAGRRTLTHEYTHIVQYQFNLSAASWLVEGTAEWAADEHHRLGGGDARDATINGMAFFVTSETPSLRSTEADNAQWQYSLGQLATHLLTADAGPDSWVEFWRHLTSTETGPHGRWASSPDWLTAFQEVSGMPVADFYVRFASWQREQAQRDSATKTDSDDDARWIRGRVTDDRGAPVAGVFVNAIRVKGEYSVDWNERAETANDGVFAVRAPLDGNYRLSVDINDDCTRYYSNGELIDEWDKAHAVEVSGSDLRGVDIQLPPNICGWQIRGRVVGPDGEPLAGASVRVCHEAMGGILCSRVEPAESDGSFAVTAAKPGDYGLQLDLVDQCSVYYSRNGPTFLWDSASLVTVTDADVGGIEIRVPATVCRHRVAGGLAGIERFTDQGHVYVKLCEIVNDRCVTGLNRQVTETGPFVIATPVDGSYRLSYDLDGCTVHYGPAGLTSNDADATLIHIDGHDARVEYRQIPADVCAYQIKGSITTSDGQPLADTIVSACREVNNDCVAWTAGRTDAEGAFVITVPAKGRYRLGIDLESCTIYFRRGGLTTTFSERSTVRVEGRSVRLNPRQIPAEVCAYQIRGSITTADGQPIADTEVQACREVDNSCVDRVVRRTDADGAFAITVPAEGRYRLNFHLEGCVIYFRRGGLTTTFSERSTVRVKGRSVRLSPWQILAGVCSYQIKGSITTSDGQPLADTRISACREVGNDCVDGTGRRIADDGSFAITVPTEGAYRVSFNLEGCTIYFRRGGFTTDWQDRSTVRVEGRSVRLNPRQIPAEMCAHRISGRFVDAASAAVADKWMNVCNATQCGGIHTAADGGFTIRVPSGGFYTFDIWLTNDCNHRLGGRSLGGPSRPIRVSGADVTGVVLRLPDTIENLCE